MVKMKLEVSPVGESSVTMMASGKVRLRYLGEKCMVTWMGNPMDIGAVTFEITSSVGLKQAVLTLPEPLGANWGVCHVDGDHWTCVLGMMNELKQGVQVGPVQSVNAIRWVNQLKSVMC